MNFERSQFFFCARLLQIVNFVAGIFRNAGVENNRFHIENSIK